MDKQKRNKMKASELRIGNLVYVELGAASLGIHELIAGDFIDLNETISKGIAQPIPLTEEWLVRFGFKYNVFSLIYEKDWFSFEFCDGACVIVNNCEFVLKYVHQLQNLYFALTNEELKLNK